MKTLITITLIIIALVIGGQIIGNREDSAYTEGYNQGAHDQDSIHRMTEGWDEEHSEIPRYIEEGRER